MNNLKDLLIDHFVKYLDDHAFIAIKISFSENNILRIVANYYDSLSGVKPQFWNKLAILADMFDKFELSFLEVEPLYNILRNLAMEVNRAFDKGPDDWRFLTDKEFAEDMDIVLKGKDFPAYEYYKKYSLAIEDTRNFIISKQRKINEFIKVDSAIIEQLSAIIIELSINKSKLLKLSKKNAAGNIELSEISVNISNIVNRINSSLTKISFFPLSSVFSRFPGIVSDLAGKLNKKINFVTNDNGVVIDKKITDSIGEVFIHLIKNSIDHGIEEPAGRIAAGKDETGLLELSAVQMGNYVIINIIDDGKGLNKNILLKKAIEKGLITQEVSEKMSDEEIYNIIFLPGFSTAEKVSDVSGRGVGMDAVKGNIEKFGGSISIKSALNKGTTITIRIPFQMILSQLVFVKLSQNSNLLAFTLDYIQDIFYYDNAIDKFEFTDTTVKFNYNDRIIPIWNCFNFKYEDVLEYNKAIIFSNNSSITALPVYDIVEQTDSIVKNFSIPNIKNKLPGNIIGYTIFDDDLVPVVEPEFKD